MPQVSVFVSLNLKHSWEKKGLLTFKNLLISANFGVEEV